MTGPLFDRRIHMKHGHATIAFRGEVDVSTSEEMVDAIAEGLGRSPRKLTLDLSEVSFFGGVGVEIILASAGKCRTQGIAFDVLTSPPVDRVFHLLGEEMPARVQMKGTDGATHRIARGPRHEGHAEASRREMDGTAEG